MAASSAASRSGGPSVSDFSAQLGMQAGGREGRAAGAEERSHGGPERVPGPLPGELDASRSWKERDTPPSSHRVEVRGGEGRRGAEVTRQPSGGRVQGLYLPWHRPEAGQESG
eukprot:752736-Hanusia_phi.AAC.1